MQTKHTNVIKYPQFSGSLDIKIAVKFDIAKL